MMPFQLHRCIQREIRNGVVVDVCVGGGGVGQEMVTFLFLVCTLSLDLLRGN